MIKIENVETVGWEPAIRGMRNPLNSWENSDSVFGECVITNDPDECTGECGPWCSGYGFKIGPNDHSLMMKLRNAGTDHRKFMRMILCCCDITAPLYWWKEFDTYRNGVEKNSCSTMHKIAEKEFTLDDFSHEHLSNGYEDLLQTIVDNLNDARETYLKERMAVLNKSKDFWWQMIQLLPSSYNQRRTCMISYEALANMYHARKSHKLDEWREFCRWVETLPYSVLITGHEESE